MKFHNNIKHDELWKSFLNDFIQEMIRFFYPHLIEGRKIRSIIFLEQELERIIQESDQEKKRVDIRILG